MATTPNNPTPAQAPPVVTDVPQTPAEVYGNFELRVDGVYKVVQGEPDKHICSWLKVLGLSRTKDGEAWGTVLKWRDRDDREHTWAAPNELLVKPSTELAEKLCQGGVKIVNPKALKEYINSVPTTERVLLVQSSGWHEVDGRSVFVLPPNRVIGTANQTVVFQSDSYDANLHPVVSHSLGDWQKRVASYCVGNRILTLGVSAAFAAPTLKLLGEASGGFHLCGESSKGKTTAIKAAASVWGYPYQTWRSTDNALENTAESHNDALLTLDELSQVDPRKAPEIAYMLANEQGKGRMNQASIAQRTRRWRLLFLSTGEMTLEDHSEAGGKKTKAGVEIRMVNLDADAGADKGIFENIHELGEPSRFADTLSNNALAYRGTAGPKFVKFLIDNASSAVASLKDTIDNFVQRMVPAEAGGEIHRVAKRFAIVGAAGELATEAGITGWARGIAVGAAEWCFKRWLSGRSLGSSDMDKAVAQLRGFLTANVGRFEDLSYPAEPINGAGFRRTVDGGEIEYLIFSDVFKSALKGFDPKRVARELKNRGYLVCNGDRLQVQVRVPNMGKVPIRFYAVRNSIFYEEEDADNGDVATADSDV